MMTTVPWGGPIWIAPVPVTVTPARRREFAGLVPEILAPVLVTARGSGAGDVANIQAEAEEVRS